MQILQRLTNAMAEYDLLMVQQTSSGASPITLLTSGLGNPDNMANPLLDQK